MLHSQCRLYPVYIQLVGGAILWVLGGLGDEWTDDVREAWTVFYGYIKQEMMTGMGNK